MPMAPYVKEEDFLNRFCHREETRKMNEMMSWKYKGGLFLIIGVVFMWVTSEEVSQGVFKEYKHPFPVSYLATSLWVFYLPLAFFKDWLIKLLRCRFCYTNKRRKEVEQSFVELNSHEKNDSTSQLEQQAPLPKECVMDLGTKEEGVPMVNGHGEKKDKMHTAKEVAAFGLCMSPIWFATEYLTNAALIRTSVASTTLLGSTSGLFTLIFEAHLGQDTINTVKVVSVIISIAGVAMTAFGKTWAADESKSVANKSGIQSLLGDIFAILSALTYGLFTVSLKRFSGKEGERVDMKKLFGYIGLFTLVTLWWLAWPLTAIGIEQKLMFLPSVRMRGIILTNCFIGSFLSDYLWALAVVWTSPLVAALGVSLTIPVAMLEDMLIHGQQYSLIYMVGSAQVFLGFLIANKSEWISDKLRLRCFSDSCH